MTAKFVADVGGTNIRLSRVEGNQLADIQRYKCAGFATIVDAIQHYFNTYKEHQFDAGCIAIACPTDSDWIAMTNHDWQFSVKETTQALELTTLEVINDYTAIAMCLPALTDEQVFLLGGQQPKQQHTKAVFGPGTGLGVAILEHVEDKWHALDGEGGHVDFAPTNQQELIVWEYLNKTQGRASLEEVLSGRGLCNLYHALADSHQVEASDVEPSDVTAMALEGSCPAASAALSVFCSALGSYAGNLALTAGALGGVYIAGGIASRFVDYLEQSGFRQAFEAKGRFQTYLEPVPTYLITEPDHGLIGAAAYLAQSLSE